MGDMAMETEGQGGSDAVLRYRDDAVANHPAVTVDAFLDQPDAAAVRVEPGDDVQALLPQLARVRLVEVNFPAFTDGRGMSAARTLREAGYAGELRACGDVLLDQLSAMRRCGFDAFEPDQAIDRAAADAAFDRFPQAYQPAEDARAPIWKLRHG